jgi:hypothetical protein
MSGLRRLLIVLYFPFRQTTPGTAMDSQDTLAFSVLSGVRSMNEVFPLERVGEAYERMITRQGTISRRAHHWTVVGDFASAFRFHLHSSSTIQHMKIAVLGTGIAIGTKRVQIGVSDDSDTPTLA